TLHLAIGLARAGTHVRFACPPGSEVEGLARAAGLEVHALPLQPRALRRNAARLAHFLSQHPVDLVNSQSKLDRNALTLLALTRRLPVPFVATRRQMPRSFPLENWLTSRLAARMIAVSRPVGEALVRRGTPRSRLAVVPNGLVLDRVARAVTVAEVAAWRERIGADPAQRTLGIVARPKDQHVVLDALPLVRTPVRLVLAGIPPGHALAARAAAVAPPHAVVCLPFEPDVRPLYEVLELVLLPSRIEGLSQALLEAMALGLPVLASDAAGNPDLIRDGENGRLVPPLEPAAWARAIDELLADGPTTARLAAAGRRTAREEFSLERTVERTLAVYREVLGR
ncbi:MAG TPA: glycosyltransferase family 4 protein, partial [Gemmatimonadales bacterium]|nr:glycosyltransferase family 4 protein [Gemmatimonadales bacterium]